MKQKHESTKAGAMRVMRVLHTLLPAGLLLVLAASSYAQSGSFGTIQSGAAALVNLIRILGGLVAVAALVFTMFRLIGGNILQGLMGFVGAFLGILIAANAQTIVNSFYSTSS